MSINTRVPKKGSMVVQNILHMNPGNGETSYAKNSLYQKGVILRTRSFLEDTLKHLYGDQGFPECLKLSDLGCSSGPNAFLVISEIIDTILELSLQNSCKAPELEICLNDLPDNDFNTIFKMLPTYYQNLKEAKGEKLGPCLISGIPGSFYCRLFPRNSLHFVHSSYSIHWLSQVPLKLENKGNVSLATTSPPQVFEAYLKQFQKDFSTFLSFRSQEMIANGRMLLTFIGRKDADPTSKDCFNGWELLAKSLVDMVSQGLIQEKDVDSFNFPFYLAYKDEVEEIIRKEGSFNLEWLDVFECSWDPEHHDDDEHFVFDSHRSGDNVAKCIRAISEPMVANHFGGFIVDDLFKRFAKHVANHPGLEEAKNTNIVVSLSKK